MYLPGGYRELRQIQGRQTSYVNLDYTGSLRTSLETSVQNNSVVLGIVSGSDSDNIAKRYGLEARYGKPIFSVSREEADLFVRKFTGEIFEIMRSVNPQLALR